ncbi:hypothetical protein BJ508DRAFT_375966 [Ascobolus immersus RN42]|uniref:Uncharacterized protein n=1 Tax=Ascobolus immersus RN42 TaxID=1160509 RepID=A0A3N4I7K5_ASCIM|nr:hypothetical protein BJ508DRAFT_375966 [Ascobolus immersus RN42]
MAKATVKKSVASPKSANAKPAAVRKTRPQTRQPSAAARRRAVLANAAARAAVPAQVPLVPPAVPVAGAGPVLVQTAAGALVLQAGAPVPVHVGQVPGSVPAPVQVGQAPGVAPTGVPPLAPVAGGVGVPAQVLTAQQQAAVRLAAQHQKAYKARLEKQAKERARIAKLKVYEENKKAEAEWRAREKERKENNAAIQQDIDRLSKVLTTENIPKVPPVVMKFYILKDGKEKERVTRRSGPLAERLQFMQQAQDSVLASLRARLVDPEPAPKKLEYVEPPATIQPYQPGTIQAGAIAAGQAPVVIKPKPRSRKVSAKKAVGAKAISTRIAAIIEKDRREKKEQQSRFELLQVEPFQYQIVDNANKVRYRLALKPEDEILFHYWDSNMVKQSIPLHKPLLRRYSRVCDDFITMIEGLASGEGWSYDESENDFINVMTLFPNSTTNTDELDLTLPPMWLDILHLFFIYMYHGLPHTLLKPAGIPLYHHLLTSHSILPPSAITPSTGTPDDRFLFLTRALLFAIKLGADEFASDLVHLLDEGSCNRKHGLFVLPPPHLTPAQYCPCVSLCSLPRFCQLVTLVYTTLYPDPDLTRPTDVFLDFSSPHHSRPFRFRYEAIITGVPNVRLDLLKVICFSAARYIERLTSEREFMMLRKEYWGKYFFRDIASLWYRAKLPVEERLRMIENSVGVKEGESFQARAGEGEPAVMTWQSADLFGGVALASVIHQGHVSGMHVGSFVLSALDFSVLMSRAEEHLASSSPVRRGCRFAIFTTASRHTALVSLLPHWDKCKIQGSNASINTDSQRNQVAEAEDHLKKRRRTGKKSWSRPKSTQKDKEEEEGSTNLPSQR